jgi:hypothetical protein
MSTSSVIQVKPLHELYPDEFRNENEKCEKHKNHKVYEKSDDDTEYITMTPEESEEDADADDSVEIQPSSTKYGSFICNRCDRNFRREDSYQRHDCITSVTGNMNVSKSSNALLHLSWIKAEEKPKTPEKSKITKEENPFDLIFGKQLEVTQLLNNEYRGQISPNINAVKQRRKYKRKALNGYVKREIGCRQGWRCYKCEELLPAGYHVDHNVPVSRGGTNDLSNLRAYCLNCHGNKSWLEQIESYQFINIKTI